MSPDLGLQTDVDTGKLWASGIVSVLGIGTAVAKLCAQLLITSAHSATECRVTGVIVHLTFHCIGIDSNREDKDQECSDRADGSMLCSVALH